MSSVSGGDCLVIEFASAYLKRLQKCIEKLDLRAVEQVVQLLHSARTNNRLVFIAGNGGSAATASHMANDLCKTVLGNNKPGPGGFRALALTDNVPLLTAWSNDSTYEDAFSGQLAVLAQPGDLLIVISGSGNSPNILRVAQVAREIGLTIAALLGKSGGKVASLADVSVIVPSDDYGIIEDMHLVLNHLIANYFKHQQPVAVQSTPVEKGPSDARLVGEPEEG